MNLSIVWNATKDYLLPVLCVLLVLCILAVLVYDHLKIKKLEANNKKMEANNKKMEANNKKLEARLDLLEKTFDVREFVSAIFNIVSVLDQFDRFRGSQQQPRLRENVRKLLNLLAPLKKPATDFAHHNRLATPTSRQRASDKVTASVDGKLEVSPESQKQFNALHDLANEANSKERSKLTGHNTKDRRISRNLTATDFSKRFDEKMRQK